MADLPEPPDNRQSVSLKMILALAAILLGLTVWSYWASLSQMSERWGRDAEYSHGYLVPLFACVLLWLKRTELDRSTIRPTSWGLLLLAAGILLRLLGTRYYLEWFSYVSLIPCVAGIGLLLLGWSALPWFLPATGFLVFMMPLPYSAEVALREPLRRLGTVSSTYIMQTMGVPAIAEGNTIVIDETRIGIVEACSGLRMLMVFFALATAVAMLSDRAMWQRALIVLSAIPIALMSNITRITVTGLLYGNGYAEIAEHLFHDLAGWLMMPLGLLFLWLELFFLSRLFIEEEDVALAPVESQSLFGTHPAAMHNR